MWVTTADQSRAFDAIAFNFKGSDENPALPGRRRAPGLPARHQRIQGRAAPAAARRSRDAMSAPATNYTIREGDPLDPRVRALIAELDAFNSALYPAESNHFDRAGDARGGARHLPRGRAGRRAGRLRRGEELRRLGGAQAHVPQAQGARRRHRARDARANCSTGRAPRSCRWRGSKPATSASARSSSTGVRVSRRFLRFRPTNRTRCRYSWSARSDRLRALWKSTC